MEDRALLLTDVVDSTRLAAELGDEAMARIWMAHDRVARELLRVHGGREIDKTDGMLLLFGRAEEAAAYARDYHRALASLQVPLRARAGLHVGAVLLRANHADDVARGAKPLEVEGLAKPLTARVMSVAGAGQTLATAAGCVALGAETARRSVGHWRLKGIPEPLELYLLDSVVDDASPLPEHDKAHRVARDGERWLPLAELPGNLPRPGPGFVGRAREVETISDRLAEVRCLTLVGIGGIGKTRLALQAATELRHRYSGGTWFVDLSALRVGALVATAVAEALDVGESVQMNPEEALVHRLREARALLVLDNCEHLAEACAALVRRLMSGTAALQVLATSRDPLGLSDEETLQVEPLPLPGLPAGPLEGRVREALRSPAVRLFADRAARRGKGFVLSEATAESVVEICSQLDGLPLAIELAAARLPLLGLEGIRARLHQRFKLLVSPAGALRARHRTLLEVIDWSFQLLGAAEQSLLLRLSVLAGGFDAALLRAVADPAPGGDDWALLDGLATLMERSLVTSDQADPPRYRMLETIRSYALERLAAGGAADAAWGRFEAWGDHLVRSTEPGLMSGGAEQGAALARLDAERDNLRVLLARGLATPHLHGPVASWCTGLYRYWLLRGRRREGLEWCERVLALAMAEPLAPDLRAGVRLAAGAMAYRLCEFDLARAHLEEALRLATPQGDDLLLSRILMNLGNLQADHHDPGGARARYELAGDAARRAGSAPLEAMALSNAGRLALSQGDLDTAVPLLDRAQQLCRETGNPLQEAFVLSYRAEIARLQQRYDEHESLVEAYAALARQAGDSDLQLQARLDLAEACIGRQRYGDALRSLGDLLSRPEMVDHPYLSHTAMGVALLAAAGLPDWHWVARLRGAERLIGETLGLTPFEGTDREHAECERQALEHLGDSRHAALLQEGAGLSLPELVRALGQWAASLP